MIFVTLYELNRLCHDVYCDERVRSIYKTEKEKALAEYDLAPNELEAVKRKDIKTLFDLGVHRFLLVYIADIEKIGYREYIELIK